MVFASAKLATPEPIAACFPTVAHLFVSPVQAPRAARLALRMPSFRARAVSVSQGMRDRLVIYGLVRVIKNV